MTRIGQHNLAARIACLSFWKQRCFYSFDWSKKRSDDPSRSMAFRLRRSLELFPRTPLHRPVSVANSNCELWYRLKLNFPFFAMQAWSFQGQAKLFDRDDMLEIRMNLSPRRGGEIELRRIVDHCCDSLELPALIKHRRKETKKWQRDWTNVQPPMRGCSCPDSKSLAFRTPSLFSC